MGEEDVPTQGSAGVGEGDVLTQGGAGLEEEGRTYTGRRGGGGGWKYLHRAARGGGGRTRPTPPCVCTSPSNTPAPPCVATQCAIHSVQYILCKTQRVLQVHWR